MLPIPNTSTRSRCSAPHRVLALACAGVLALLATCLPSNAVADAAADCSQDKDLQLRVQGCTQYLATSPAPTAEAAALLYRGYAYGQLGKYDAAITDLTDSIGLDADRSVAYRLRGEDYEAEQKYDLAIADFNTAIRLTPDDVGAYLDRGKALLQQGNAAGAIDDFNLVMQKDPNDAYVYYVRGLAYQQQQQYVPAIADFSKVIQLKPDVPDGYEYRGDCLLLKGDASAAIADFDIMIQKKPDMTVGYFMRARANILTGQYDGAIADLNHVMTLDSKVSPTAHFYRALAYEAEGRGSQAESDFASAIAGDASLALERRWVEYLKSIQDDGNYANWSDKPYDLYLRNGG